MGGELFGIAEEFGVGCHAETLKSFEGLCMLERVCLRVQRWQTMPMRTQSGHESRQKSRQSVGIADNPDTTGQYPDMYNGWLTVIKLLQLERNTSFLSEDFAWIDARF